MHSLKLPSQPTHDNLGDSFIWLGELRFLERHNIQLHPFSACLCNTCDLQELAAAVGKGTILIHGMLVAAWSVPL